MNYIEKLVKRYPQLDSIQENIKLAFEDMKECYENGGKLLVAGNGGSASDAEHIVGELMKGFVLPRKIEDNLKESLVNVDQEIGCLLADRLQQALPAICLSSHSSLSTAILNDICGEIGFAQQLNGYGTKGDIFLAISTSGNSKNIIYAAVLAKAKGMKVIGMTGETGGKLIKYSDILINVPERETYKIQELHLPIYHCLCMMLEDYFYNK